VVVEEDGVAVADTTLGMTTMIIGTIIRIGMMIGILLIK